MRLLGQVVALVVVFTIVTVTVYGLGLLIQRLSRWLRKKLLSPNFMMKCERDPYFMREYARPVVNDEKALGNQ